jgi:hypothetical protein
VPREETLDKIEGVLKYNQPAADVYSITTICLSYLSGLLGMMVLMYLLGRFLTQREKKTAPEDIEGIELTVIKVNSLNKSSPALATTDTLATFRRSDESARATDASGQSTPLPVYSHDVASQDFHVECAREPDNSGQSTPPPEYPAERIAQSSRGGNAESRLKEAYGINANRGSHGYEAFH